MAVPFEIAFEAQKQFEAAGSGQGALMQMHYRDEEVIYVQPAFDRVTVFFTTVFREETDRIFGKVFLQVRSHPILSDGCRSPLLISSTFSYSGVC